MPAQRSMYASARLASAPCTTHAHACAAHGTATALPKRRFQRVRGNANDSGKPCSRAVSRADAHRPTSQNLSGCEQVSVVASGEASEW